jgi:DNA-binding response OmpR family regulator
VNCGLLSARVHDQGAQQLLMSRTRVLCVEKHPDSLGALTYMLETAGYEVTAASNGDQALRLFTTLEVDGVLLEYDLPDQAGRSHPTVCRRGQTNAVPASLS